MSLPGKVGVLTALAALAPGSAGAQGAGPVVGVGHRVELTGFYHALNAGYGAWRGVDARLQLGGRRIAPYVALSAQRREEGRQASLGGGGYLFLGPRAYAVGGVSAATSGSAELYPLLRWDLTGVVSPAAVPGLALSAGMTDVRFEGGAGGWIASLGSAYYRGRWISQGVLRLNRDRVSGAGSYSAQLLAQSGEQGSAWTGGSVGWGTEAYTVVGPSPFDARFESVTASLFHTRWTDARRGFTVRSEYEHRFDAYDRLGLSASVFVEF